VKIEAVSPLFAAFRSEGMDTNEKNET